MIPNVNYRAVTHGPRRLALLFVLLSAIPVTALGWLGWHLLQMDETFQAQRQRDLLQNAADAFAGDLERALGEWERTLTGSDTPAGTTLVEFDANGVVSRRGVHLPYYPLGPRASQVPPELFARADAVEFRGPQPTTAATAYRALTSSPNNEIRAEALARLARVLRNQGDVRAALATYDELAALGGTQVFGSPAEFLARRERIDLFTATSNPQAATHEASRIREALAASEYVVDFKEFEYSRELVGFDVAAFDAPLIAASQAAEAFLPIWRQSGTGRKTWAGEHGTFMSAWRTQGERLVAILGSIDTLLGPTGQGDSVRFSVDDEQGRTIWGGRLAGMQMAKTVAPTGLPWTVRAAFGDPLAVSQVSASSRRLYIAGLLIVLVVVAAAGYVGFRAVSRELSVATLQSEFVATVSHEFRTPITAMRHLTELLERGGVSPERQALYYAALAKEMRRLHGMVENVLDFGRIESGRRTYQMETTTAADLARQVVEEVASPRVVLDASSTPSPIRADRDALALALRNLVDNAIKYSPDVCPVRVSVQAQGAFTGISVEDQGAGIGKDEQRKVFRKFVRGAAAQSMNVKGTGIGLAMAEQIVRAHGGRLELVSEPSRGSRFTILLPVDQA